ncbi:phage holin family protein [Metabacillus iocasae]|uniref:Membrane protein n=1 Tax=Priestia iocasae TaxID=2291674 RepID=A0ABS2QYD0_9BACI|nr:phage holin family protein [Metabacillus iocasae]MBM7704500.1 putative membrane protein [Metabacillus iocasae]
MFLRWLTSILINALVLIVIAGYFESFYLESVSAAIIASIILSILNVFVKPIIILLTLPVTVLTLGLFLFVINAITLVITDELMGSAFEIEGFGMAILAAIVMSILNALIENLIVEPLQKRRRR